MKRLLIAAAALLAGCVSVSEGVGSFSEVGGDAVLVVGKIEIIPPIRAEEQRVNPGADLFNVKRHYIGRAILFTSDTPAYRERTDHAMNPPLEQTFFLKVPRAQPYIVKGSVTMDMAQRQGRMDQTELLFPVPLKLDLRAEDKAVYVGTLRLHRDEFHEVTKVELRDDYASAIVDYRKQFGAAPAPRKALLRR